MQKILIVGATSAIAEATARLFATHGDRLYLLARSIESLEVIARDLKIRGAESVSFARFEANDFDRHKTLLDEAVNKLDGIDVALIAHGSLPDQKACEQDFQQALKELNTNAISVISLLTHLGNHFEAQKHGTIAVISSVAGDRGRQSNYVYGTAKGALTIFLQGLRNRLHKSGVQVLTVKPGFVDTPMTADFLKGPLWAKPEKAAADIFKVVSTYKDEIYTPWFWQVIMLAIKSIPESIFKRLSL
ncbi:MAG: SDR family oxidoreductase [Candidatus Methylumidiphilus sp.]